MEASTTIRKMMTGTRIQVPTYQRAYSWETPEADSERKTHTDIFLSDLEEYKKTRPKSPYYFGHFLFEERQSMFYVIDGQQRLTTIVIFLAALFTKLKTIRGLSEAEEVCYEDMVKRRNMVLFSTVDYDNQLFRDYVIEQKRSDKHGPETASARRIVRAFDFFTEKLSKQPEEYLTQMLCIISDATCTTHPVKDEAEAIQMFIFQNNRGKKPSNLEIIKAQFMFRVHLYGGEETEDLIGELKNRFEKIYKSISSIDYHIDEDDVLVYTLRVHFNSLWKTNAIEEIDKRLSDNDPIPFIRSFTHSLAISFEHLTTFFGKDERDNIEIHSLVILGGIAVAIPFIIKAYRFGLSTGDICALCSSLESMVLRHRLIGTKAYIESRIGNEYENFTAENKSIKPIISKVETMKTATDWWWAYWNDSELEKSIQGGMNHSTARYLLWKYENHLESQGQAGYVPSRFDRIERPELEHIAPITEPVVKPHGYGDYDDEFKSQYLDCLGNYLLLSKSHNCVASNASFPEKRKDYTHNEQQREIQKLVPENGVWSKEIIRNRKKKIVEFIMKSF
jgi:hypothetical protein